MSVNNTTTRSVPGNVKKCAVCKITATQACSSCKNVYYCNRDHQRSDWKSHSKNCPLFELADDPILGLHYAATRIIKAQDIIVHDKKPILAVPLTALTPCCLNCYVKLTLNNYKDCAHCGWPLCLKCTKHGGECKLTMKYRKTKVKIDNCTEINRIYEAILVMRAIAMRDNNQEAYRKLMRMKDLCDKSTKVTNSLIQSPKQAAILVQNFMKIHDLTTKEIAKIIEIARVNGIPSMTTLDDYYLAIFEKAPYILHSCHPNSRSVLHNDSDNEANIIVRAVTTIPKGHPITITHTDPFRGTAQRRVDLRKSKFFDCACKRCSDPTEFGTMFNAIKCFNDKCDGYMLPPTFLVSAEKKVPDYVCDKCKAKKSSKEVDDTLDVISNKLSKIASDDVAELKKFIDENSMILHKNHFHIIKAEFKLAFQPIQLIGEPAGESEDSLNENINLCQKLIDLLKKLMPGEIALRGKVLIHEYSNMCRLASKVAMRDMFEYSMVLVESNKVISEYYQLMGRR